MSIHQGFKVVIFVLISSSIFGGTAMPSYFAPNHVNQKTGKSYLENPEIAAFYQTQAGRVLFSNTGAFFNVSETMSDVDRHTAGKAHRRSPLKLTPIKSVVMKLGFPGQGTHPVLVDEGSGKLNILKGSRDQWRSNISLYNRLTYKNAWPGIDLGFNKDQGLSFSLLLKPDSDASSVKLETGADLLSVDEDGRLHIALYSAEMILGKPFAFQDIAGERIEVGVAYQVLENGAFTFQLDPYDVSMPLIIDPTITWGTYLGGDGELADTFASMTTASAMAIDGSGNYYIAGNTWDIAFPVTSGAYDEDLDGQWHYSQIIAKFSAAGSLQYATFLGQGYWGTIDDILVDGSGQAIVCGWTDDPNFPTTANAHNRTYANQDGFITHLNATGTGIIASTLFGGNDGDGIGAMVFASDGDLVFTGRSFSTNLPHNGTEYDRTNAGNIDVIVGRISSDLQTLRYVTFLGGTEEEMGLDIAVDASNNAYITGYNKDGGFPVTSGAYDETFGGGGYDCFIAKISGDGTSLSFATYIGGSSSDCKGYSNLDSMASIALSPSNDIIVTSDTYSTDFPTTPSSFSQTTSGGEQNCFVLSLSNDGTTLNFSGRLGGTTPVGNSAETSPQGLVLDSSGHIYITGFTGDSTFPTTLSAYATTHQGEMDTFVTKIQSDGSTIMYSTLLGGEEDDLGTDIALTPGGQICVIGSTFSSQFPTTSGAYKPVMNCTKEIFFTKFNAAGTDLEISTFLGGSRGEEGTAMAMGSDGHVYVTGCAMSTTFPLTAAVPRMGPTGDKDVFVTKLNSTDGSIIYSTIFGGYEDDTPNDICISSIGEAYVVGETNSPEPPVVGSYYAKGSKYDVFVSRLNAGGTDLIMSTVWGGSGDDKAEGVALTPGGDIMVVGTTDSSSLPLILNTYAGGTSDAFMMTVHPTSGQVSHAYYHGGTAADYVSDVAVGTDGSQSTYIILGCTFSTDFPMSGNALDSTHGGETDGFISEFNPATASLLYSTYFGGNSYDNPEAMVLDSLGVPIVAGDTSSTNYPVTSGAYDTTMNGLDGFVTRVPLDGSALSYSTYLGGTEWDSITSMTIDAYDDVYVVGHTRSSDFPMTSNALDATYAEYNGDGFLARLSNNGEDLTYGSFIGGSNGEELFGVALEDYTTNKVAVAGNTWSTDFPTTPGSASQTIMGFEDVFVVVYDFCNPEFITQPQSTSVCDGASVTFTTEVRGGLGATGFTYEWYFEGALISGAPDASFYAIAAVSQSNVGAYTCRATNDCGTKVSDAAQLTIANPVIVTQPVDTDVCEYGTAELEVIATGSNLTYQWQYNGSNISGETSQNIEINNVQTSHQGNYRCLVSNSCSSDVYSAVAFLTVEEFSVLEAPFTSQTGCVGEEIIFNVTTIGNGLTFQWQKRSGVTWQNLSGETADHIEIPNVQTTNAGFYRCHITSAVCGSADSSTMELIVLAPVSITDQPEGDVICVGGSIEFHVTAEGGGLTYQWEFNGTPISGATSQNYVITGGVQHSHAGEYQCVINNPCSSNYVSDPAILTVTELSIDTHPSYETACVGGPPAVFQVTASGVGLTYQWQKDQQNLSGETEGHIEIPNVQLSDAGDYRCEVTNACGSIYSDEAELSVKTGVITITSEPESVEACIGASASLCVVATSDMRLYYKWYLEGVLIPGETSDCLNRASLVAGDFGMYWVDMVTECGGSAGSQGVYIEEPQNIVVSTIPGIQVQGLVGLSFQGDHNLCSNAGITYEWENLGTGNFYFTQDITLPVQQFTTDLVLTITQTSSGNFSQGMASILVAPNLDLDFNNDGCNSPDDLLDAFPYWHFGNLGDFNNDGNFDVRDFLYINLDDPMGCGNP